MIWKPKTVYCPVGKEPLGYITKDKSNTFLCHDCQWIFTFDNDTKLIKQEKYIYKKPKEPCGCGGCGR